MADVVEHGFAGCKLVQLVLREIADADFAVGHARAIHQGQAFGDGFYQRRLALTIGADNGDAVVGIQAECHAAQDAGIGTIAEFCTAQFEQWRCHLVARLWKMERHRAFGHRDGDILHLFEHLDAGLGLTRL